MPHAMSVLGAVLSKKKQEQNWSGMTCCWQLAGDKINQEVSKILNQNKTTTYKHQFMTTKNIAVNYNINLFVKQTKQQQQQHKYITSTNKQLHVKYSTSLTTNVYSEN
jgi:hypothetical protein